jgi:hypothetical protein
MNGRSWDEGQGTRDKGQAGKNPVRDKLSVENAYSSFFYPVRDKLSVERSFAVLQFCSFAVSGKAFWNYPSRDNK